MQLSNSALTILFLPLLLATLVQCAKNYYNILGVPKGATDKQIKRAFRKLAVKYHPDKNKNPDAEKQFVEMAKAYEILSDPEKRKQYDQLGHKAFENQETRGGNGGNSGYSSFSDFFKQFDESLHSHRTGGSGHRRQGHNNGHKQFKFNFGDGFWDGFDNDIFGGFSNFGGFGGDGFGDDFMNLHNFGFGENTFGRNDVHNHHHGKTHTTKTHTRHSSSGGMHGHRAVRNTAKRPRGMHGHRAVRNTAKRPRGSRSCKKVTTQVGNRITTYTDCS